MDPDPESPTASAAGSEPGVGRKERGAIAAQACENCRNRKQKCDERRPRCTSCQKFNYQCRYREPQPTKRDKTLLEILDHLKRVENKIDILGPMANLASQVHGAAQTPIYSVAASHQAEDDTNESLQTSGAASPSPPTSQHVRGYQYVSSVCNLLEQPVVRKLLEDARYGTLGFDNDGPLLHEFHHADTAFPLDNSQPRPLPWADVEPLQFVPSGSTTYHGAPLLNWETVHHLSGAFFDTFNLLYPILDRPRFNSHIALSVVEREAQDSIESVMAFLILALGEVVLAASSAPVTSNNSRVSGIKGGTYDRPAGLYYFNEARRRMGFVLADTSLENIQMFALAALYYGSCGHQTEFWRMTVSASAACRELLISQPNAMHGPRGDIFRRIFWHCSIMETCFHMELDVPLTDLGSLSDTIGLPSFHDILSPEDYNCNEASHFQEQFTSQIALHRLLVDFHSILEAVFGQRSPQELTRRGSDSVSAIDADPSIFKRFSEQLDQWRKMLPIYMQWSDNQSALFTEHDACQDDYPIPNLQDEVMFTSNLDDPGPSLPYAIDVQNALLRSRYYYSKYLIHRPFVLKALHHPRSMTREDAEGAAECLRFSLKWPIAMSPPCCNKRLVPVPFFWSQNFFGILVLLHLSRHDPMLSRVRSSLCGPTFDRDAAETVSLYVDWLRDMRLMDASARRYWGVVRLLYGLED